MRQRAADILRLSHSRQNSKSYHSPKHFDEEEGEEQMINLDGKTPVATFTAAAGRDYGFVAACEHEGKYLILCQPHRPEGRCLQGVQRPAVLLSL